MGPGNLPWWIAGLFGLGVAIVTAFGPDLLPEWGRWSAFSFGAVLILVSGFELLRHWWRAHLTGGLAGPDLRKSQPTGHLALPAEAPRRQGQTARPFSQMSDVELGADCIELAQHFSMKDGKTETTRFVNAQQMYAEAILLAKELRDRGFLQKTPIFQNGDIPQNFIDFSEYLTQVGTLLSRGNSDIARRFASNHRYSATPPIPEQQPQYEQNIFSVSGIIKRGQQERLHIRTQEALERVRLESAKAADFAAWDRVNGFSLRQAAQLWAGERPSDKKDEELSQMAQIILSELVSAANADALKATAASYPQWVPAVAKVVYEIAGAEIPKYDLYARTTREDLRTYAASRSERPPFLFPEDR